VIWPGKLKPADGKYSLRGPKVWYKQDETPVAEVFSATNIPNNAAEAFQCFDMAKQLMDEELNTTQWASDDNGTTDESRPRC
jgi:hypothetical protein